MKSKIILLLLLVLAMPNLVSATSPTIMSEEDICCYSLLNLNNVSLSNSSQCDNYNLTIDSCERLKEGNRINNLRPMQRDVYNYPLSDFYGYIALGVIIIAGLIVWYFMRKRK